MDQEEIEHQINNIHGCLLAHEIALQLVLSHSPQALDALQGIDLERLEAKQALFAALEPIVKSTAVLATNTSSIPVALIAAKAQTPDRILALHFFNPPTAMKLVELAPHAGTSSQAVTLVRTLTEAAGKTVIECRDRPGFIVNRCARPYYGEALALLAAGLVRRR